MKLLGQRLMARDFDRQVAEIQVRIAVLNHCPAMHVHMHERGLYRARHTHHRDHGLSLSGERGAPTISRFAQQSPFTSVRNERSQSFKISFESRSPSFAFISAVRSVENGIATLTYKAMVAYSKCELLRGCNSLNLITLLPQCFHSASTAETRTRKATRRRRVRY